LVEDVSRIFNLAICIIKIIYISNLQTRGMLFIKVDFREEIFKQQKRTPHFKKKITISVSGR